MRSRITSRFGGSSGRNNDNKSNDRPASLAAVFLLLGFFDASSGAQAALQLAVDSSLHSFVACSALT